MRTRLGCQTQDTAALIAAINTANGNGEEDTIILAPCTYTLVAMDNDTDGPNGLPSITSPVTIQGASAETTVIMRDPDAPDFRLMHVGETGRLTLEGMTLRGGYNLYGGAGLFNGGGTVTLLQIKVAGNAAEDEGGGLLNERGTVTIAHSTFASNGAFRTGGAIVNKERMAITHTTFIGNGADISGGIHNTGSMTLTHSTFTGNGGYDCGGFFNAGLGLTTISHTTLTGNEVRIDGGPSVTLAR